MPNIWSNLGIDQDVPEPNLDDPITINLMQNIGEFFTGFFIGKTFCDATFRQATKGVFLGPKVVPKAYRNIALLLPVFLPVFIRVIQNLSLSEDFDAGHVLNIVGDALFFSNVVPRAQTDFHNELDRMRRHLGYDPGTTDLQILRAVIRIGPEKFGGNQGSGGNRRRPGTGGAAV